jgi:exosortase F-associated protein
MNKAVKTSLILFSFLLLALIRAFQTELFTDPFIAFFKGNYASKPPPILDEISLYINTAFRYFLNTVVSLFAIYIAFPKKSILKFSVVFYVFAFVVLMTVKIILIQQLQPDLYSTFFYVRRFLIQPLFVIILLPAFYYQEKLQTEKV